MVLDLVNGIEEGQHLAIGMVTPGQKSLQTQNRERALALSAKQTQLQVKHPPQTWQLPGQPHRCLRAGCLAQEVGAVILNSFLELMLKTSCFAMLQSRLLVPVWSVHF